MKTIDCPLQSTARVLADHPAIICGDTTIFYKELNTSVWAIADYLHEMGIQPGDRVAILAPTSIDYIKVLYALWRIGAVACPMSTRLPEEALNEQLQATCCSYLITTSQYILTSLKMTLKKINLTQTVEQIRNIEPAQHTKTLTFSQNQDATIIFTSGSQGKPKPVMHSYANHFYSAYGANNHISFNPEDRWLLSLPLYHVAGLGIIFRVLLGKGTIIISSPGKALEKTIETAGVTHISLVATQLFRLLNNPTAILQLKNLTAILLGGSTIPNALILKSIKNGLPIYTSYGLTEMASQVATTDCLKSEDQAQKAKILPYREVKLDKYGEIFVKGKTLFKGYVHSTSIDLPTENDEGWFATGDLGSLFNDEYLKVSGRKDNMFISGGENIRPEEIERFLCQLEIIEQAIVVPRRHDEFGLRPVAFIKKYGNHKIQKKELIKSLQNFLPKFMTPDEFYTWPTKTNSKELKVNRSRLKKLIQNNNPDLMIIR